MIDPSITQDCISLLKQLIRIQSFSKEEDKTADCIAEFFNERAMPYSRHMNNVWAKNRYFDPKKANILLNSHHDTVKPNTSYTRDPFDASSVDGKIYGLGSNDAGGPLVSLLALFLHFYYRNDLPYNLVFAATAEEEISGKNGVEAMLPLLPEISFGVVGEPTSMDVAIAEKGLLVIDCEAKGVSGHAARDEGVNAIYAALPDIEWFRTYQFPKVSETLGKVKMTVSMIQAGTQHNVVPDSCKFTVDVRVTDAYSLEEVIEIIKDHVSCQITPRSVRLQSSGIEANHQIIASAKQIGMKLYGSPTLSDQALMPFSTIKLGPGDSARSHSADEYIFENQIVDGIAIYVRLFENLFNGIV